jgi:UDP-N-acetylglucosamine 2-epimerase (non-hydrolysing)
MKKKLLFIFGTRPEAIKLAPIILAAKKNPLAETIVCITGQHREQLDSVLTFFKIVPDYDLNLMKPNQSLFQLTANAILKLEEVLEETNPDVVLVQGDTTTVMAGALGAFYKRVKIAHVEAGLRSFNKFSPFPEEINRLITTRLADFHFVPTESSKENLLKENVTENIHVVGNSVIDALKLGLDIIESETNIELSSELDKIDPNKKIILVTCHRRESFGEPFLDICKTLNKIADEYPNFQIVYPVHLNPNIQVVAKQKLNRENILLISPLDYPSFISLMQRSYLILTDSGGVQEEAPSLGKPILVLREVTERMEGIEAGTAFLCGTDSDVIFDLTKQYIEDEEFYNDHAKKVNPYGDGTTSQKILEVLLQD